MGGDGGVVAAKRKYLDGGGTKDPDAVSGDSKSTKETQGLRSRCCALSSETLRAPIVACEMGHLYNKEAVLRYMLDKKTLTLPEAFFHLRNMRDVKEVHFTAAPSTGTSNDNMNISMCPVTGLEFNGMIPFVVIWSSGVVVSEKAVRELGVEALQVEYGPFKEGEDVVRLLPYTDAEMEQQQGMMAARRAASSSRNKGKKDKKKDGESARGGGEDVEMRQKKRRRKEKEKEKEGAAAAAAATSVPVTVMGSLSKRKEGSSKSDVYSSLFHKS
jgi:hypothetical protein